MGCHGKCDLLQLRLLLLTDHFLLGRLTGISTENNEFILALQRVGGEDESSEEEEEQRWWSRRRILQRGVENVGLGEGNDTAEEVQARTDTQRDDALQSNEQPAFPGESSEMSSGHVANVRRPREGGHGGCCKAWTTDAKNWSHRAPRSAWPHWVYRQFDAYDLARRAAGMLVF